MKRSVLNSADYNPKLVKKMKVKSPKADVFQDLLARERKAG